MVIQTKNAEDFVHADSIFKEKRITDLGKQLLKGRLFVGTLHEKYYVEKISTYRNVVAVDNAEHQLIRVLEDLLQHIGRFYRGEDWSVAVTRPGTIGLPKNYCLWVELPEGIPLGKYWFKIRTIKFNGNELSIPIRIERPIDEDTSSEVIGDVNPFNIDELKEMVTKYAQTSLKNSGNFIGKIFADITKPHNAKSAIVFAFMLVVACITGLFELLKFSGDFLIKFIYAMSHFVNTALPVLQMVLKFLENVFKVMLTFVAYMFGSRKEPVRHQPQQYVGYEKPRRSLEYYPKYTSGAVITELN